MIDSFHVTVDKAQFLQVGRVLRSAYRGSARNVILTLHNGTLFIEFYGGGCELPCEHEFEALVEMTAKKFARHHRGIQKGENNRRKNYAYSSAGIR